jgi:23S rRNA (uracil1939-C5)-methyltransferase
MEIEKMVYGGKGMGRAEGKVVFVPFTAPGERVEAEVVREKKDYAEANLKRIENPSPRRRNPFCPLYGECGGCQYQHFSYEEQLKLKEAAVGEALHRLSPKASFEILPIMPSPMDRGYRIRAQMKAGVKAGRRILGFYAWGTHQVVAVQDCPLLHPLANRILSGLNGYLQGRKNFPLNGADLQVSPDEGQGVVSLRGEGQWDIEGMKEIGKEVPEIKGIVVEGKEGAWGKPCLLYKGPDIGGRKLLLQAGGKSFVQVNPDQNRNLIGKVLEWAHFKREEKGIDLFCGSGNLTLPLALRGAKVWGVDQDREAINSARENARRNLIRNCAFWAGTAEEGIGRIKRETGAVDLVVLDPPRVGAHSALIPLVSLHPRRILYVSCEPPTLARDLAHLVSLGYNVKRIQPLDMFPQTYHIEVIAELEAVSDPRSAFSQNRKTDP